MQQKHFSAATADFCDSNLETRVLSEPFINYGGKECCAGIVETVWTRGDTFFSKKRLAEAGEGRVLLIDNNGSLACSMIGDNWARKAVDNNWAGIVINGAVRDAAELREIPIAIFALGTCPQRSENQGFGELSVPVTISGQRVHSGEFLVADADGVVVSKESPVPQGTVDQDL